VAKKSGGEIKENERADEAPNGAGQPDSAGSPAPGPDPEMLRKLAAIRTHVRESFGQTVLAMIMLPRYRRLSLEDLQQFVLEPLLRDRVAIAYPGDAEAPGTEMVGLAIWASVSEEVDGRIRDQIRAGTIPVRLNADDWNSGPVNWLLDVIAPDRPSTARVIANFKQVVKQGSLRLHPLVARLVDEDTLRKMGAERMSGADEAAASEGTAV
jgi:hemolysin-activating ACP:hemolysin acyltransferase